MLGQLRKSESEVVFLQTIVEDLDAHAAQLLTQVSEACKEAAFARDEVTEAHRGPMAAREATKAAEDTATTAADDAQDVGLQAGFKVLRQALLQIVPSFDVKALDVLVTLEMVDAIILEAEAEHEAG